MIYDQVIIGCGLAGLAELKKALEAKKNVCVVAKNFGATQFLNGELNFSGAEEFCAFYGVPAVERAYFFGQDGCIGQNGYDGVVLGTQSLGLVEKEGLKKVAFVVVPGLTDFPAALVEANLKKTFPEVSKLVWSEMDLNHTSPHAHLLQLFDGDECVAAFEKFLKKNKGGAELIVCPPILGIKNFAAVHERLEKNLGVRIVEQLSSTPPVAGLRFVEVIKKYFSKNKVNVVWGEARGFDKASREVKSVDVECLPGILSAPEGQSVRDPEAGSRIKCGMTEKLSAKEFTLATGKFIGGGIVFKDGVRETIFNLPCVSPEGPVSDKTPITSLITRNPKQDQALWGVSVCVDEQKRVVDPVSKKPIYENLRAVGQVCAD